MTKLELLRTIALTANCREAEVNKALAAAAEAIIKAIKKSDSVILDGFGHLYLGYRAAHTKRNPRTQAIITIPAKKVVKFRASRKMRT